MNHPSMRDYIDAMDKQAFDRLGRMGNDEILSRSVEEWIADFIAKIPNIVNSRFVPESPCPSDTCTFALPGDNASQPISLDSASPPALEVRK